MVWLEGRPRASRFPITTPVLFRERGESEWRRASTLNVSRSGVLFRAEGALPGTGHAVDFVLTLLLDDVTPPPRARCAGHVVRVAPETLAGGGHAVAVTIDHYTLEGPAPV
jgi:hypothetical protein